MSNDNQLLCYNRGCGQKYNPDNNGPESCRFHIGAPVFHDAYKGWSCCKKKCTDFTEFLNIKGCTVSYHSNVKPPEPQKPEVDKSKKDEIIEYSPPKVKLITIERPSFDTPLTTLKIDVSPSLKEQLSTLKCNKVGDHTIENGLTATNIPVGTQCKNNACKMEFGGAKTLNTPCEYHPGYPVFHEGLKFWSCCTKRTTDFDTFLNQKGCTVGEHVWIKEKKNTDVSCRLDWHQTASNVYVTVFGKKCDPDSSKIELSPIRLKFSLYFPEQCGYFSKDMELIGIVSVETSSVQMTPTKIEIKLKKLEAKTWNKLEINKQHQKPRIEQTENETSETVTSQIETIDLGCL